MSDRERFTGNLSEGPPVLRSAATSEKPQATPNYATWLTKAQAAAAIGVTTKTIEAWARQKRLEQAFRPQARGPQVAVFHPDDVARLASERHPAPAAFVLPARPDATRNGGGHHALAVAAPSTAGEDLLRDFLGAVARALATGSGPPEKTSQTSEKLWLTLDEAAAVSGRSVTALRRKIRAGELYAEKDRGWKVRRKDLEAL